MKKIYSLFMALSIVLCAMANSPFFVENRLDLSNMATIKTEKQLAPVEKSSKAVKMNKPEARQAMVAARQAKAAKTAVQVNGVRQIQATPAFAKQAMPTSVVRKAPAKAAEATDTVVIVGKEWSYEYYAESGDWYMAVIDATETYLVRLDYFAAEEDFAGTYTIDDLDLGYSYLTIYDEDNSKTYVDYVEANFTITVSEGSKFLEADILCENGIRYLVSATEVPVVLPEATDTVELAYSNATLVDGTRSSETFQFWADENGIYTSLLMASDQVEGEYTEKDMYVDYANYIMFVDGTDTTFVDFLALNLTITKEDQTYFADAYALGVDTIMYHITMSYTKPAPTDTIDIVATNMVIDEFEFFGMYFCTVQASNEEYNVTLDMANGLPLGELTNDDFNAEYSSVYRIADKTEIVFNEIISATVSEVDGQRAVKAQALGVDNIIYNMDLSYVKPEATDTVSIVFAQPAVDEYYDSMGDHFIYNEDENFVVYLDIFAEKDGLVGEYSAEDFDLYYTAVGVIENGDTAKIAVVDAKAVATAAAEGLAHIEAELLGENSVLYLVSTDVKLPKLGLQYDAEEGAIDRSYTTEEVLFNDQTTKGYIVLDATAADGSDFIGLQFIVNAKDAETIIPTGTYEINHSADNGSVMASSGVNASGNVTYSLYGKTNANGAITVPCYFLVGGTVEVSAADGKLTVEVNAVNSYNVPIHAVIEYDLNTKQGLQYDAPSGALDYTFAEGATATAKDNGFYGTYVVVAPDASSELALLFIYPEGTADAETTIPAGTYAINDTQGPGTVLASSGVSSTGGVGYSFFANLDAEGYLEIPLYFLVSGTVEVTNVDGKLKVEVNGLNSNNVPVHVVYDATAAVEEEIEYETFIMSNLVVTNMGDFDLLEASDDMNGLAATLGVYADGSLHEASAIEFMGEDLPIVEGNVTKAYNEEVATDVYTARLVVDFMGNKLGLELLMYAGASASEIEVVIEGAAAVVDETTGVLQFTATWTDSTTMVTYPVKVSVAGYEEGKEEYAGAQISELEIGDDDNWFDFAVADAVAVFKDGNAVALEGEYTSWATGTTYYVAIEGELPVVEPTTITWELNGGEFPAVVVPTNAELWEAFKPYYNTYYGLSRADQPIDKVSTFAAAKMQEIMTDEASEYKWLGDYVLSVATAAGVTLSTDMAAANEGGWRWAVHAFFNAAEGQHGAAGINFTEAGKPEVWGAAYEAEYGVVLPTEPVDEDYTLPTPVKEGYTFVGWYDNAEGEGEAMTVLPAGWAGTLYAIWAGTPTGVENTIVAEQATKVVRNGQILIIKNGVKYNVLGSVVE